MCGSDGLSLSSSLLICGKSCRCQAENPLNALPSFTRPALTLHRVFDEILKYEGRPRLDQAAAFCNLADFDGCKSKAFRKSRDGRNRILMVARDEHDSSTDIVGQWAGENLDRQLIEGLD